MAIEVTADVYIVERYPDVFGIVPDGNAFIDGRGVTRTAPQYFDQDVRRDA
jgi:hypothetical protein